MALEGQGQVLSETRPFLQEEVKCWTCWHFEEEQFWHQSKLQLSLCQRMHSCIKAAESLFAMQRLEPEY
jgi:hypothetical protein